MDFFTAFLVAASLVLVIVLVGTRVTSRPPQRTWIFFALGGIFVFFGLLNRHAITAGLGCGLVAGQVTNLWLIRSRFHGYKATPHGQPIGQAEPAQSQERLLPMGNTFGGQLAIGLAAAVLVPTGLFIAFLVLAYLACVTGNGCL